MWSHQSASSEEPETTSPRRGEAWYMWSTGGYVVFPYDFGSWEEYWSGPAFNVDDPLLGCTVDADVVEPFEFASSVPRGKVFLPFGAGEHDCLVLLL